MKMDKMSREYLIQAFDELKKIFATKDKKRLKVIILFYSEYRAKHDPSMKQDKWFKFLYQKYKQRMRDMDISEYNFKDFKDCDVFEISPNIVALRAKDGTDMLREKFLYFHRDSMGTWAWCQNSDIIDFEDKAMLDEEEMYLYKQAA